jgi:hypothetical protein
MNEKENKNILLSYSHGDFFYVKADDAGVLPTVDQCKQIDVDDKKWEFSCNSKNYSDNAEECFKKELCKNREKVNKVQEIETRNSGSNRKYLDVKQKYNTEYLDTVNLGIGIILVTAFIIKNTYNSI